MPGEQFEHLKIDAIENMSASFHIMVKFWKYLGGQKSILRSPSDQDPFTSPVSSIKPSTNMQGSFLSLCQKPDQIIT